MCAIGVAVSPEPVHGGTTRHLVFTAVGAIIIAIWPAMVPKQSAPRWTVAGIRASAVALAIFLAMLAWNLAETRGWQQLGPR